MAEKSNTLTVKEYRRLGDTGILHAMNTVELIQGRVIDKNEDGYKHSYTMKKLISFFTQNCANQSIISVQEPLLVNSISEFTPDIKILKSREDFYSSKGPKAKDVLLLVEVSEGDIETDKKVKLPFYAGIGIVEIWIVNIPEKRLEVYRQPSGNNYTQILLYRKNELVSPTLFPNVELNIKEIFEEE